MAIYTRTGDKGKTSLMSGQRVSKADLRVEAYGTIDELNSAIGVAIAEVKSPKLKVKSELEQIQNDLFDIGSNLADTKVSSKKLAVSSLPKRVKEFENFIDKMTQSLPPLKNFILPGGGKAGAFLHLARAISRRAERKVVALSNKHPSARASTELSRMSSGRVDNNIIIYLNRLSDLLFTMARFVNFKEKKKEVIWTRR